MKALDPAAEAALLVKARHAPEAAITELVRALRGPVFALCLHLARDRGEAEDATQETFLAVHRGLAGFRQEARLSTWVYRIAIRMAGKVRARRASAEVPESLPDPAPGPERSAAARLEVRRLLAALEQLPAEQRVVLALFAVDGLGHAQIAEVLGVPEGTVWSRLHGARKRLAALLG